MENEQIISVENINVPGKTSWVYAAKYQAMKKAMLEILPDQSPELTQNETREGLIPHLPDDLFPCGSTACWWVKTVQLD